MATILGLDYGLRWVGVAVSDDDESLALPLTTLMVQSKEQILKAIADFAQERHVAKIVVGIPYSLGGGDSPQTESTKRFIEALRNATSIPIDTMDERLTTVEAQHAGATGDTVDKLAAMLMLQTYLDRQHLANPDIIEKA